MLQFIVLGQIPGTHYYLTFVQTVLLLGSLYAALWLRHENRELHRLAHQEATRQLIIRH